MVTSSTFPLSAGAVLSLSCNEGYEQSGDKEVTCTKNTEFQFNQEPICGELGGGTMAKNGEKWRWRIRLFHLSNSPFFANFLFWNFRLNRLLDSQSS